ncbi:dihydrofolate reductase family protein [Streptomyces sp. NPDC019990]|uniref:dihydrofolate reductase family protein n=1 Tax=Streptomyces sp. NPDC019990 TaxID=3154693 RepID=UPI0033F09766
MSKVFASLGMSLDGFIAGPNARPDNPLGDGGMRIHEWVFGVESWRERQSINGGQTNPDDDIVRENFSRAGAYIMGQQMFAEGEVGWPDPPPFRAPVFVLTHTPRKPWVRQGGTTFTFVTEGIDSALALAMARKAAGDKDVQISGGADTVRQFINAGLLDELQIHLAPLVLGSGVRLFDGVSPGLSLELTRVVDSPQVTHLTYRVSSP